MDIPASPTPRLALPTSDWKGLVYGPTHIDKACLDRPGRAIEPGLRP
jgi:hypothetical protein